MKKTLKNLEKVLEKMAESEWSLHEIYTREEGKDGKYAERTLTEFIVLDRVLAMIKDEAFFNRMAAVYF